MQTLDMKFIVYNAAAGLVAVSAFAFIVRSMLPSSASPCAERYHTVMAFTLEREGVALTAADLQGRLGGRDFGLIQHVNISHIKDGPTPVAMAVTLPKGSAPTTASTASDGGMSFPWEPRSLQGKTTACLSYHMQLPANFDPAAGGALPGIRGADHTDGADDSFVARLAWRASGEGGADQVNTGGGERRAQALEWLGFGLPRGQWMKVDQEVTLNAPGRKDGALRIWIDGGLVLEKTDMDYRTSPEVTITGVAATVFYGSEDAIARAPRDTKVWLSPFEIRWQ